MTGRTATISVSTPMPAQASKVSGNPTTIGRCSRKMNQAPNTPPSMPTCPAVKLITREAENMTL